MSLKVFHLFFISIAALFSIWFGMWSVRAFVNEESGEVYLILGILSFAAAIALIIYDIHVLRKFRAL